MKEGRGRERETERQRGRNGRADRKIQLRQKNRGIETKMEMATKREIVTESQKDRNREDK